VFRYALGLTRSLDEAEEITADTFERALRAWQQVPPRPVAWLLLTARRIATDRWRRARRLARIVLAAGPRRPEPLRGHESEFGAWFDGLAAVLTPRQREVLILRYQRDLTDADIGAVMGLSESGVRSLVARALAVLRSHPELL
jgi:RNA polymerase sigma factor (sigma-70 family)